MGVLFRLALSLPCPCLVLCSLVSMRPRCRSGSPVAWNLSSPLLHCRLFVTGVNYCCPLLLAAGWSLHHAATFPATTPCLQAHHSDRVARFAAASTQCACAVPVEHFMQLLSPPAILLAAALVSCDIACSCSRLLRYCWKLLSPPAILLAAALASSDIAGSCSRLKRSCWQLLSPRAIFFAAGCSRLLRRFMELASFASCESSCSCFSLLRNSGEPISSRAKISKCTIYSLASRGRYCH